MKRIIFVVLILSVFTAQAVWSVTGKDCQVDTECAPCSEESGNRCRTINGKRIDHGGSLGSVWWPPANTERRLVDDNDHLHSATEKVEIELVPVREYQQVIQVASRAVLDSTSAPRFRYGGSELTPELEEELGQLAATLVGKENLRLQITGHTDSHQLAAATARIYGDNFGLGRERARNTAAFLARELSLPAERIEIRTAGPFEPVASNDSDEGRAKNRRVEIFISYDEQVTTVEEVPVSTIKPQQVSPDPQLLQSCAQVLETYTAAVPSPYRISVDGVPLADEEGTIDPDIQRCTDLMLARADIQVRFDGLESTPWLNLSVDRDSAVRGQPVTFTAYSNYEYWIKQREVRIFAAGQSLQSEPLLILPMDDRGQVQWAPEQSIPDRVEYLLRVYDAHGAFDETYSSALLVDNQPFADKDNRQEKREQLIGYGENRIRLHNIPVRGGAITVNGSNIPPSSSVTVLGRPVPVAANGRFAVRQILPPGHHEVDVQVVNELGQLDFNRRLYLPENEWFYIGIADLVVGRNKTSGPAELVTTDTQHFDDKIYIDGRLAFYLKGKIKGEWLLTAAADTREQPIKHIFSNFDEKDPRYLLRRLDPDQYYPVYGDDSTAVDDAPTSGKFYVKLQRGDSHIMWGNFQTRWTGTDFARFNRGMYGANLYLLSDDATSFGERRTSVDLFAGDPGTLGGRDEFRGTGGSLFYLRRMDVTRGSERVWVEVRDRDSGLVLQAIPLVSGQDYDLNPIQGRLLLTSPLSSMAADSQLVRSGSLSGHPQYLVVTYEYTPNLREVDNLTLGGRAQHWFGDHLHIGASGYRQEEDASKQRLGEVDATFRYSPGTYVRTEVAQSKGAGSGSTSSVTGGFEFEPQGASGERAYAQRVEGAVDLSDISQVQGDLRAYWQRREAGFSAPGQLTNEEIEQFGGRVKTRLTNDLELETRADVKASDSQDTIAAEVRANYQINSEWDLSVGLRHDDLDTNVTGSSPTWSQHGRRTDLAGQLGYKPKDGNWSVYGFGQGTVKRTGDRRNNNRAGLGGRYRMLAPLTLSGEVSGGSGGFGSQVGADWRVNERSQLYLNYVLDTDRTDSRYRGRQGQLTAGGRQRYSEALTVFAEERYLHGSGPSGLIHAFGLDLAASDRWNFGFKGESGRLSDPLGEDLKRTAMSLSAGYVYDRVRYAGNLEWRHEDGSTSGKRITWLLRNSIGYQTTPAWRFLGKLNLAFSDSRQGDFFDAEFVEAVAGYAYRPVDNDRLNALFKYTFFYDLPSAGAVTASNQLPDYAQKSHILSVDGMYDLLPWLSVGGKYGYRYGALRDSRVGGTWFSSNAHLGIIRTDLHFVHQWDAVIEGRMLRVSNENSVRQGMLLALYRHVNRHVKLGAGYNFTDFSDDLTVVDYRSRGWFINLIGKM